ncbi:hypothetical protein FA15DRAFT_420021 [Coprinopsis marcescibilis]|uniref:Uncharacterized protein n=1 Tax=Coprinopsis marcescibilis TaxID=230819 RepID=A0A5C3KV78_COPMA|nr:hypothetical protein FA15DRAFT_420021 [Coprinopsis marcescibilis]
MSITNPSSSSNAGRNTGNKVRGIFEVVHGLGDNIRGTFLGAVDTMMNHNSSKNDEIARQGRLEMQRGLTNMRSGRTTTTAQPGMVQSTAPGTGPWSPAHGDFYPQDPQAQSLYAPASYDRNATVIKPAPNLASSVVTGTGRMPEPQYGTFNQYGRKG